jgi:multimeric flavodoxin WrbA
VVGFATPIYFFAESGMMRSCLERILFQFHDYDAVKSKYPGKTKIAYMATMNIDKQWLQNLIKGGFSVSFTQDFLKSIFGNCSTLYACDTLQVNDYKAFHITVFDEAKKRKHHEEQFGIDLKNAYDLGVKLVRECQ